MKNVEYLDKRDAALMADIDKMFIPSSEIDKYEQDQFGDQVLSAQTWRDELIELSQQPEEAQGLKLPWNNADGFRLRPAELTVWSGYNGHGKSLILTQIMLYVMKQGQRVAMASLELSPVQTLRRMAAQAHGIAWSKLSEQAINQFFDGMGKLDLYTEVGDIETHRVLAFCKYCHAQGIQHVVVDSLMKCGIDEGDYAAEKKFINSLQNIAKNTGLHIHLVAHAKKRDDETIAPTKFSISGSTHISNIADNVVICSRNKRKEIELRKAKMSNNVDKINEWTEKPDTFIDVSKQRHHTWEKTFGVWFDESEQFVQRDKRKMSYL